MALFELRQYRVLPGRRDEWVRLMEEVIVPFQASKGMVIVGSFVADEDPDLYIWIRRFEDDRELEELSSAVYEDDCWKTAIAPRIADLLGNEPMPVTRLIPTPRSVIR